MYHTDVSVEVSRGAACELSLNEVKNQIVVLLRAFGEYIPNSELIESVDDGYVLVRSQSKSGIDADGVTAALKEFSRPTSVFLYVSFGGADVECNHSSLCIERGQAW